ncbi:MAG TPA: (2Fe-2S) ferredoxin domain-containing protein [Limnobacter sp.]|nr:(2Fe-2S) ferredoxin domain-containing protein [Limnobacter sp.]
MSYFDKHVFFCTNQRPNNESCCANCNASDVHAYAKQRIKALGLSGQGKIRMNKAGCLDRCDEGPVLVVYPEGVWYTYVDNTDVDEIIDSHLVGGQIVERLRLP